MGKTKIFEALEHAGQNPAASTSPLDEPSHPALDLIGPPVSASPAARKKNADSALEKKMVLLYQGICASAPGQSRVVTFISALPGEGTSPAVRQLALVVAAKLGRNVALLDANHASPAQSRAFGLRPPHAWGEVVLGRITLDEAFCPVPDVPLLVSPISLSSQARPVFSPQQLKDFFTPLKAQADLVLIDAPALQNSPESLALCAASDGVVLVIEAEKTRREVVQALQETLRQHGAVILGVALTNRRLYVPKFIYDRT